MENKRIVFHVAEGKGKKNTLGLAMLVQLRHKIHDGVVR